MSVPGRIVCRTCGKPCYGQVLRVEEHHFHPLCFVCHVCKKQLKTSGFFLQGENFYCAEDFQKQFGTQCHVCGQYVEGDVITALGKMYHQSCFVCAGCGKPFPPGEQVVAQGDKYYCEPCLPPEPSQHPPTTKSSSRACAQCGENIKPGQALLALDKLWHVHCFACHDCCRSLTSQQFMSKDGAPYCLQDYYKLFGVKCASCGLFISGKVIQAGDNHYHAQCSKCMYCQEHFSEGIDIYILGQNAWHTDCSRKTSRSSISSVSQQRQASIDLLLQANAALTASRKETPSPNLLVDGGISKTMSNGRQLATPPVQQERESGHSFGGDSAISCTTPSSISPENDCSISTNVATSDQQQHKQERHEDSSASTASTPSPSSEEGHPLSPVKSPLISPRPKSIAFEPSHGSGARLSQSLTSGDWKSTHSCDSLQEHAPLVRSSSGQTLASGVLSSSLNRDRLTRAFSVDKSIDKPREVSSGHQTLTSTSPCGSDQGYREKVQSADRREDGEQRVMYSLQQLQVSGRTLLPTDVDRTRLEDYLSREDFESVFGMTRDSYSQLQKWRQNDLKRKAKLF